MFDPRKIQLIKNVQNLKEFNGSMRRAITAAGYSQTIADNPKTIFNRKWFQAQLPDYDKTSRAIHELMDSGRIEHYVFPLSMTDEEICELVESFPGCRLKKIKHSETQTWAYYSTPDNKSKKEAIDIVLKVRGDYAPDKVQFVDPIEKKSPEELLAELDEIRKIKTQGSVNNG